MNCIFLQNESLAVFAFYLQVWRCERWKLSKFLSISSFYPDGIEKNTVQLASGISRIQDLTNDSLMSVLLNYFWSNHTDKKL